VTRLAVGKGWKEIELRNPSHSAGRTLLLFLFFVSGFAALLYQVVWQRMIALFSGADVFSVTLIVASFMAGLGLGAVAGGYIADRVSHHRRVVLFALAEMAVALFALLSPWLYYDVLYGRLSALGESPVALTAVLFAALLWPTFWMGVSLPLLAAALTRSLDAAASRVGALYGVNTLGAAVGAVTTVWVLARHLGFETSLQIGAGLNALCAVGALAAVPLLSRAPGAPSPEPETAPVLQPAASFPFAMWVALYGLSGFVALSLEIVWFRLLGVMIKSSAFTFGTLLGVYLVGLAVGTLAAIPWARRVQHPARAFFALQAAIPLYAGLSVAAVVAGVQEGGVWSGLAAHFAQYHPLDLEAVLAGASETRGRFTTLYAGLPLALVGPPTLLMGLSFPFLQKVVQTDLAFVGRRVGWLQAANIAGSTLGAVGVGWLLLGWWGSAGTLRGLVGLSAVFLLGLAATAFDRGRFRTLGGVAAVLLVVFAVGVTPGSSRLWSALHGTLPDRIILGEDGSGVSLLRAEMPSFARVTVFVNGRGQSWLPYGDVHTWLGILSVFVHPEPRSVAVIGLGSGDTLFAAGGREVTRSITNWELIEPQLETLRHLHARQPYGGLESLLHDERIEFRSGDGRAALMREPQRYDVIEADALRPNSAYAGNLYSLEFFELLRGRLEPGGMVVSWAPTPRIRRTFLRAFPYVQLTKDFAVGSNEPFSIDAAAIRARAQSPFSRAYYESAGIDLDKMIDRILGWRWNEVGGELDRGGCEDVNTDLHPRDEFLVPEARPKPR
jgi:predicted membrane-bound spermidine synthase